MMMKQQPAGEASGPAGAMLPLEDRIHLHLLARAHTSETLSLACRTSVPTVARALARLREALRKEGLELVSVRAAGGYRYEIYGTEEHFRRAWSNSRLRALAGSVPEAKTGKRMKPEDGAVYARDW